MQADMTINRYLPLLFIGLMLSPDPSFAQPSTEVPFTEDEIVLDGKMSESVWMNAAPLSGFSPFEPHTSVTPKFTVEGKVLSRRESLLIFLKISTPSDELNAPLALRDSGGNKDRVSIQLDPYGDGRRAYSFTVTPSGVLTDGLMRGDEEANEVDKAWNSLFDAGTHIEEDGWSVEIEIPYRSLRFEEGAKVFKGHIFVYGWKAQQALSWAPIDRDNTNWLPQMGEFKDLRDPQPGRDLELVPSVTMGWAQEDGRAPSCKWSPGYGGNMELCGVNTTLSAGGKWAVNSSTTMDMAFNPDFSQVEADPRQLSVNNRFALQLEERRPFFLEGIDLFRVSFLSLAQLDRQLEMIYTRSINQPLVAAKLTGQEDNVRYGAFIAYDQTPPDSVNDPGFSPSNMPARPNLQAMTSIARSVVDLGSKGSIGVLVMDKEYLDGADVGEGSLANNQVFGLDGQVYATPQLSIESAVLMSHAEDLTNESRLGYAGRGRLLYRQDSFRLQSHYETIHSDFRSEAGFVPRTGFHNFFNKMDFFHRSESNWARVLSPGAYASVFLDEKGELSERVVGVNHYWRFGHQITIFPEFEKIAERVEGRWLDTSQTSLHFSWRGLRVFEFSGGIRMGDTVIREDLREDEPPYVGWRFSPSISVIVRPTDRLSFQASHFRGLIYRHEGGELLADQPISRLVTQYFFTRNLTLRGVGEWDAFSEDISGDLLLSYQPSPATLLFLGYREEVNLNAPPTFGNRSVFAKFSYLFSL